MIMAGHVFARIHATSSSGVMTDPQCSSTCEIQRFPSSSTGHEVCALLPSDFRDSPLTATVMSVGWASQTASPLYADVDLCLSMQRIHGSVLGKGYLLSVHRGPVWVSSLSITAQVPSLMIFVQGHHEFGLSHYGSDRRERWFGDSLQLRSGI